MSASGEYLLGDSEAHIRQLVAQADVYAPETDELLDRVGIGAGGAAIDLGCGALGIVHLLAQRVGPTGRVVGLDREATMLDTARELAAARGVTATFVNADATATGLPADSFDLVHARTVLINVSNPAEILAEMVRLARPGGVVAIQEPDTAAWVCDPPHPSWAVVRDAIVTAYAKSGKDLEFGRRSLRALREAGLAEVDGRVTAKLTRPGDYYQTFVVTLAGLVREPIVAGGLDAVELDFHLAALTEHLTAPDTTTCQPNFWQAWGRKVPFEPG